MQIGRFGRIAAATAAAGLAGVLCAAPAAADTVRDGQWPLQRYGASQSVWLRTQGEGVTVAVIGSGVNAQQQDLVGQVLPGRDFTGRAPDGRYDVTGQGTGTASLIAGHGHGAGAGVMGLAPKVRILPVRIGLTPHGDSVPGPLPPGSGGGLEIGRAHV